MLKTLYSIRAIQTTTIINMIIFYLQKLPVLRKLITSKAYAHVRMKRWLSAVAIILHIVFLFGLQLLYYGVAIIVPLQILGAELSSSEQFTYFLFFFFIFTFITGAVSSATILEPKRQKYVAIKLFRMNPNSYMKAVLTIHYITFFIFALPAMLLFALPLGAAPLHIVLLTVAATLWRICSEWIHLFVYKKTKIIIVKKVGFVWGIIGLSCLVTYGLLLAKIIPTFVTTTGFSIMIGLLALLGVGAAIYLLNDTNYRTVTDAATNFDDPLLNIGQMITDQQQNSVAVGADQLQTTITNPKLQQKIDRQPGQEYLFSLFRIRHQTLLRQPFQKKLIVIAVFGIIIIASALLFPEQLRSNKWFNGETTSYLFFPLLFLFMAEKTCRSFFYNCDLSMLRYPFYRKASADHFRIRLRFIVQQNMTLAAALATVITIYMFLLHPESVSSIVIHIWISILALALFFSIHDLLMYYMFQPYSTDKNVRNPVYQILNSFLSAAGTLFIFLQINSLTFALICLALALIHAMIAPQLVEKYAIRTFRIK